MSSFPVELLLPISLFPSQIIYFNELVILSRIKNLKKNLGDLTLKAAKLRIFLFLFQWTPSCLQCFKRY